MPTTDKDMGAKAVAQMVAELKGAALDVGFFSDADEGHGGEVATIASANEFGTRDGRIPARPFMRSTFDAKHPDTQRIFDQRFEEFCQLGKEQSSGSTRSGAARFIFTAIGAYMVSEIQRSILNWSTPPNAASTQRGKRGTNNPLIDTGMMRKSVTFRIHEGQVATTSLGAGEILR